VVAAIDNEYLVAMRGSHRTPFSVAVQKYRNRQGAGMMLVDARAGALQKREASILNNPKE
jgi:hypothetical protein